LLPKIREILLTQYIGAILTALLACQAIIVVIAAVIRDGLWYIGQRRAQSVLEGSRVSFPWENMISTLVTAALYVLTAYLLARWLYPVMPSTPSTEDEHS
jgi:hypothetical protein